MNGKEQWIRFYKHEYQSGTTLPNLMAFHMVGAEATELGEMLSSKYESGRDWFGVEWVRDTGIGKTVPDPRADFLLDDICEWREVVQFPNLDEFDFEASARQSGLDEVDRNEKLIYFTLVTGPFERLHALMGFEEALAALLIDPEEVDAFFTAYMDWRCDLLERIKRYYDPDVIMYHDDVGTQRDMFMDPGLWREIMKPHLKRATDKLHELGIFMEYHSCGKIERIVPDLVEIGVDAWQGQEINDIMALKEQTGGMLEFHPILDYQKMIAEHAAGRVDLDGVRAFTRDSIARNMPGGHYAPLMVPFGDEVTMAMMQEFGKAYMGYVGDPE